MTWADVGVPRSGMGMRGFQTHGQRLPLQVRYVTARIGLCDEAASSNEGDCFAKGARNDSLIEIWVITSDFVVRIRQKTLQRGIIV